MLYTSDGELAAKKVSTFNISKQENFGEWYSEISRRLSWFQNKVLCKIGELSFSMYLVHYFFATSVFSYINSHLFQNLFSPELCLILYFGSTVFVSFWISKISYKLIEKPSVNIGRNIITKLNSLNYSPKAELR